MSDPFETLKHLDEGPAVPALPASEVRRLGDRMRRRRTVARTVGAACAVAVIATGGVALGGNLTRSAPPAAPPAAPTDQWRADIPRDFPLDQGFPEDRFIEDELVPPGPDVKVFEKLEACGRVGFPTTEPEARLGTKFTQPEDFRTRLLTTYADESSARAVLTNLVDVFDSCPREPSDGTQGSVTLTEVRQWSVGDEGYVALRTYEYDGRPVIGLEQVHVIRVGNAILLVSTANDGGGTTQDVDRQLFEQFPQIDSLADSMCIYSRAGCP